MKEKLIIGIDPSGNFHEGKGTTGLCVLVPGTPKFKKVTTISASDYETDMEYWQAHIDFLETWHAQYSIKLAIEDYLVYADKATSQINSKMETPQLIGVLKFWAFQNGVPNIIKSAGIVKPRWTNEILEHKRYIKQHKRGWAVIGVPGNISRHTLDAIRHAVHEDTFGDKEWINDEI